MNILHIDTGSSWRGGQNQIRMLLNELDQRNICSTLAIPADASHRDRFLYCDQIPLNFRGIHQISAAFTLNQICRQKKIQLIHAHSSQAHNIAMIMKLTGTRIPIVVSRRVMFPYGKTLFSRYKYSPKIVSHFVAVSNAIRNFMIHTGTDASQISVIHSSEESHPPATDRQRNEASASLKNKFRIPDSALVVGFCGALTQEKGSDTFLRSVTQLPSSLSHLHFVIAGSGNMEQELRSMVQSSGLEKRVHFSGFISNTPEFLQSVDLFVFPSLSEGLGTTLLQAAYQRCPVIASDTGGIPEIIIQKKTGLLVPPGQEELLGNAIFELCKSDQNRKKYAENLLLHVQSGFSPEAMAESHKRLYQSLSAPGLNNNG